jgi:hypothetical protein
VRAAEEEILLIFPTTNAFIRQEKIGVIQVTKKVAKELDVQVRILMCLSMNQLGSRYKD